MKKNNSTRAGSEVQYGPRIAGEILHDYLENSNEPLAVAYREHHDEADGWHANTDLGCNVKTLLRSDKRAKAGKSYLGLLRLDLEAEVDELLCHDPHYTFTETLPQTAGKRNPHVFVGRFITITRRDDGSFRPNFKPIPIGMSVNNYAFMVYCELRRALKGLIEED